jgi:hypothetical protein
LTVALSWSIEGFFGQSRTRTSAGGGARHRLDNRIGGSSRNAGRATAAQAPIKTGQDLAAPLRIVETVAVVNETRKRAKARMVLLPARLAP